MTALELIDGLLDLQDATINLIEYSTRWTDRASEWDTDPALRPRWERLYQRKTEAEERYRELAEERYRELLEAHRSTQ